MKDAHPHQVSFPAQQFEIRIRGQLDESWSDWLEGMDLIVEDQVTTLRVEVRDQAALRGILSKIWDVNLYLISVNAVQFDPKAMGRME